MPQGLQNRCQDIYAALMMYDHFGHMLDVFFAEKPQDQKVQQLRQKSAEILKDMLEANTLEGYECAEERFRMFMKHTIELMAQRYNKMNDLQFKTQIKHLFQAQTLLTELNQYTFDVFANTDYSEAWRKALQQAKELLQKRFTDDACAAELLTYADMIDARLNILRVWRQKHLTKMIDRSLLRHRLRSIAAEMSFLVMATVIGFVAPWLGIPLFILTVASLGSSSLDLMGSVKDYFSILPSRDRNFSQWSEEEQTTINESCKKISLDLYAMESGDYAKYKDLRQEVKGLTSYGVTLAVGCFLLACLGLAFLFPPLAAFPLGVALGILVVNVVSIVANLAFVQHKMSRHQDHVAYLENTKNLHMVTDKLVIEDALLDGEQSSDDRFSELSHDSQRDTLSWQVLPQPKPTPPRSTDGPEYKL